MWRGNLNAGEPMQSLEHKVACMRLTSAKAEVGTKLRKTITTLLQSVLSYSDV